MLRATGPCAVLENLEMSTYTYYLSRDINLEVRLKVSELILQKGSPEAEADPQVYVSCQLYADGHPLSIGALRLQFFAALPTAL